VDYEGVIIEESLRDTSVLGRLTILSTRVEPVTEWHQTPWLTHWTFVTIRVPEVDADEIAALIARAFDREHATSWYADYKNDTHHYVIYSDCGFYIDRHSAEEYDEARTYGIARGLPEHQADFIALIED
jgi:hypothetical protein